MNICLRLLLLISIGGRALVGFQALGLAPHAIALPEANFASPTVLMRALNGDPSGNHPNNRARQGPSAAESKNSAPAVATKVAELREKSDIWALGFSPDGQNLAASGPQSLEIHIWVWRGDSHIVRTLSKPHGTGFVTHQNALLYSPDGRFLAVSHTSADEAQNHSVISIWNLTTGTVACEMGDPEFTGVNNGAAFSPDGHFFIRSSDGPGDDPDNQLTIYSTETWKRLWGLRTMPFFPETLAVSRDGGFAALGGTVSGPGLTMHAQIVIVDLLRRTSVRTLDAFAAQGSVGALDWNADGTRIAAARMPGFASPNNEKNVVKVLDAQTGRALAAEPSQKDIVRAVRYTPDGRYFLESGIDGAVQIWDSTRRELLQQIPVDSKVIAVSRDSHFFAVAEDTKIEIWELSQTRPTK